MAASDRRNSLVATTPQVEFYQFLTLSSIRQSLIQMENEIIFNLVQRAAFKQNLQVYDKTKWNFPNFDGSMSDWFILKMESVYSAVRRYESPDEIPFNSAESLPAPVLHSIDFPNCLEPHKTNISGKILDSYRETILPKICHNGDDGHYGSSCVLDMNLLTALSRRIHYGRFVAEVKYKQDPIPYIEAYPDGEKIGDLITVAKVEKQVLDRIERKAAVYCQDLDDPEFKDSTPRFVINPRVIRELYKDVIIPMTKEVEVQYLLEIIPTTSNLQVAENASNDS